MDEIKIVERPLQDVMEHAITLEESERRLTEMIHNYESAAKQAYSIAAGTLEGQSLDSLIDELRLNYI